MCINKARPWACWILVLGGIGSAVWAQAPRKSKPADALSEASAVNGAGSPVGACCLIDTYTCINTSGTYCNSVGSTYAGDGTDCSTDGCIFGACCLSDQSGPFCENIPEAGCSANGGSYAGDDTDCNTAGCGGACCMPDGNCINTTGAACSSSGGSYAGDTTDCSTDGCPDGACCLLSTGSGCINTSGVYCAFDGGTYAGNGTDCSTNGCIYGACCLSYIEFCYITTELDCSVNAGDYAGDNTDCSTDGCPVGACCLLSTGSGCINTSGAFCASDGGTYAGDGSDCSTDGCIYGACCLLDQSGPFCLNFTENECSANGGSYAGDNTDCSNLGCRPGACCLPDGSCISTDGVSCILSGGTHAGDDTDCSTDGCPVGACCLPNETCISTTGAECSSNGGAYAGDDTDCSTDGCPTGACCEGSACTDETQTACLGHGGTFIGYGIECFLAGGSPLTCPDRAHPGWNSLDVGIELTANQPTYWSAFTGLPATGGVSPFTILNPGSVQGRPDPEGSGQRVLRGFIVAWAVNNVGAEIRWNHLKGDALIVNYAEGSAWEYASYAFQVVDPAIDNGEPSGTPGVLNLNGVEYDNGYAFLLLDFYAAGSNPFFNSITDPLDTDLTLMPLDLDLRQESGGPVTTKASFTVWNQNETKLTGLDRCITCWDQALISRYAQPNHLLADNLQTNKGKAQIDGLASDRCDFDFDESDACTQASGGADPDCDPRNMLSIETPLLGLAAKHIAFGVSPAPRTTAGSNLIGTGTQPATIFADLSGGGDPPPERPEPSGASTDQTPVRVPIGSSRPIALAPNDRASASDKGSLLIFPKIELRWDPTGTELIQDTFIDLTNDFPEDVQVQMYFVNGDPPLDAVP